MSSRDPESRPDEATPLLRSPSNERNDAPVGRSTPASEHNDVTEEINVIGRPGLPSNYKAIFTGFVVSLVVGIVTLAFLFTESLLAEYGREQFDFSDLWFMNDIRVMIFWTCIISIAFSISNIICLRRTRKPFSAIINAVVLGMFTFMVIVAVAQFTDGFRYPPTYCRVPIPDDDLPDYPEDPSDGYPDYLDSWSSGSFEECQKWAPKMQAIKEVFLYITAFYSVTLAVLFIVVLYDAIRVTTRFFRTTNVSPRLRRFGTGQLTFEPGEEVAASG
ncbi:hypothetical protein G7Z17_g4609 [Cylindrodendrum hubeiense]|uniref:Uncharacterized protein n=1 Tax=Cylindrodendrum hubeiense TaxID=595255 RepID=A0A9P5HDL9_9HYPO|nr:hypothetical protein G7Z17_g4609 [Cylindrodendrum hubeiense]